MRIVAEQTRTVVTMTEREGDTIVTSTRRRACSAFAWDGVDSSMGDSVEIEKGNLVGPDIEVYDWGSGQHRDVAVQSIQESGGSVEVEVYDYESGGYRTFD